MGRGSLHKLVDEAFKSAGDHLAEDRVGENSGSDAVHGQDLDTEGGKSASLSLVAQEAAHVSDVAETKMLLEVVRLEKLDALLRNVLVEFQNRVVLLVCLVE